VVSGFTTPQSLVPTSTKLLNGRLQGLDSVSGYAKAAAKNGGRHLKGLGEAGYKFVSSQYGQWRSGSWEGASARCAHALSCRRSDLQQSPVRLHVGAFVQPKSLAS
jgi:hypothetical protein